MYIMKKLAIFDFDGTLFDSICDVLICFNETLTVHDLPTLTREELIPCLGGDINQIVSLVLKDNNTTQNLEKVKETYLNLYNSSKKENTIPFPNAHEALRELQDRGTLLAVNSNRLNYSLNEFVGRYFSDIDFLAIEGQSMSSPAKPDPYGVNMIIEKANVNVDDVVYIGDSSTDIKTAQNAGIECILVKWGYGLQDDFENEYILKTIDDFDELLEII